MALSAQEEQELAAIEQELQTRQSPQAPQSGLTQQEEFELAQIEQELASRQKNPTQTVDPNTEADLGLINRSRYVIEPLESNRKALLVQQFGQENVMQDDKGNVYVRQGDQFRPVNMEGLSFADATEFAGATPEMAGTAVGSVFGGGIPGAFAGGAAGSLVRQGASALLGTPQVATVGERITETGLSSLISGGTAGGVQALKYGAKIASPYAKEAISNIGDYVSGTAKKIPGVQTVGEVLDSSAKATKGVIDSLNKTFSFKRAGDADELFKIADSIGIDKEILPEAVEYGENSMISRTARTIAEGPLGEEKLVKFQQAHNQISNALDDRISRISPTGSTMTRDEAGQFIVDSVNEATKDFFNNLDETFSNMVKGAPGLKISPESQKKISSRLLGLERVAKGEMKRGIGSQKQEGKSLFEAVQAVRSGNGSFKQTVEAMQRIGREAFKKGSSQNRLPVDQKNLQKLYFDIQDEVIKNVREVYGDDAAENLVKNNKMITDFIGESGILTSSLSKDMAPEKVFKALVENGDTRKAEALMAIMPPGKVQSLKASFLDTMIKRNADGDVLFDSTIKNLDRKKELVSKLFTSDEMQPIADVLRLGKRMGRPVMSSSGTGASNAINDFVNRAKGAVFNEATLDLAKKRGSRPPRPPIKSGAISTKFKRLSESSPATQGGLANLLTDNGQRGGAYFVRGPVADNSNGNKKRKIAGGKK